MIKVVLFDLDDTLFPEIDYVKSGFKCVSHQIDQDFNVASFEILMELFYMNKKDVYDRTLQKLSIKYTNEYLSKLISLYRNHKPKELIFYDDVKPFLKYLKVKQIKNGIITDGRSEGQKAKMEALGCYSFFDKIIVTDDLGGIQYRKPNFKSFEIMKDFFKVDFSEMVYIGDNPMKDFKVGCLGVRTIQIERNNKISLNDAFLNNILPHKKVNNFYEIEQFLNETNFSQ